MVKKIGILILLSFFFFSFCCYNVYALAYTSTINGRTYTMPEKYMNLLISQDFYGKKPFLAYIWGSDFTIWVFENGIGSTTFSTTYSSNGRGWTCQPSQTLYFNSFTYNADTLEFKKEEKNKSFYPGNLYRYDTQFIATFDITYNGSLAYSSYMPELLPVPQMSCDTSKVYSKLDLYTQYMTYEQLINLELQMSTDVMNWESCPSVASLHDTNTNTDTYAYFTTVTENGDYYFRFYDKVNNEYSEISSVTVLNIYSNIEDTINIIMPELNSEIISKTELKLYTQWLTEEQFKGLKFFVSQVSMTDFFFECNTYETKEENGQIYYRFFKTFSENGTFYAFFHNGQARSEINFHITMYAMDGENFYYEEEEELGFFGKIAQFISNIFSNFFNTLYHIVIPTDEQWNELSKERIEIKETLGRHIPFVRFIF